MVTLACQPTMLRDPSIEQQSSGTTALLQAVSVVNEDTVWVSGHDGTYARTTDGGATWHARTVPGADTLEFRDVHVVDGSTAYLLSAGPGEMSRIYKTNDAGDSWDLQFVNSVSRAFFDCFDFWDGATGVAFSDAVNGAFIIMRTMDGETWGPVPNASLPMALAGEGSFAASGTCLRTLGDRHGWIGTGASDTARVLMTKDRGRTWEATPTPIVAGEASGIAALVFADTLLGWAFGGTIGDREQYSESIAHTSDGGHTWTSLGHPTFAGAIYGASLVPGAPDVLLVVGPGGMDLSIDGGDSWVNLQGITYWAIDFASARAGWAVGPSGRIAKVTLQR